MEHQMLSSGVKVRRLITCYHWYHLDGSRCRTPHDLCELAHLPPVRAWEDDSENLIVTLGLNTLLDNTFNAAAGSVLWYVGLVNNAGYTAYAAGDTLASHTGWAEGNPYSGNRPAWTKNGAASNGAISNSSSKASFSINAPLTLRGSFLASVNTGTSGTLFGVGDFTGGNRAVVSGDTITAQVDLSVTAI